ncbi:MAG: daptide-type RiPP biosynthesis methyltransferase [Dermatophilaceae bacterium]
MTPLQMPGRAGTRLRQLGERARIGDLYGTVGAGIYHRMASTDAVEVRELLALARGTDGPILDLAAGSGRITLPLLTLGRPVTALELSAAMLDILRRRADALPASTAQRLTLVQADMSAFALPQRFGAIVLGITSVCLLDEDGRRGLYDCVRAHLTPEGRFLVTLLAPDPDATADADTVYDIGDGAVMYSYAEPGAAERYVTIIREQPGQDVVDVCTSRIREITAAQLTAELERAHFVVRQAAQIDGEPVPGRIHNVFDIRLAP